MNQFLYSAGVQDGCDCISSAVSLGDFVYTSAQMGQGDSIEEQTITSMNKIIDALSNLGCELRHVIKFSVYVTDIQYKEEFLKTYKTYVEQPFPAVTFLEVKGLDKGAKLAMEAFAINTIRYEKGSCSHECSSCNEECSNN